MKKIDNKRQALIWGVVTLLVLGFTIGIFLELAPHAPFYSYWIAMADVCLMEIITGIYFIYILFLKTKKTTSELPVAMHISMQTTVAIFFGVTIVIDILFLLVFYSSVLSRVFMWVVIGKWILLLAVIALLQFAGREGEEEKETLASSRVERVDVLSAIDRALNELRRLPAGSEKDALQRQVVDELETLRNQVRSRVSARPVADDAGWHLDNLLDELGNSVGSLNSAPESERRGVLLSVQKAVRKMSREIDHHLPAIKKV
jgi:FlaA1/EpsC-like NDP-sugar epimerase